MIPPRMWKELTPASGNNILPINALVPEKVEQAIGLMNDLNLDAWLTFNQEMGDGGDPVFPIIFGERDLGRGVLLLTRHGDCIAIVGFLDAAIPRATGVWNEVVVHYGDFKPALVETLTRLNPQSIAINYSSNNAKADGLSYGNYLKLREALGDTPYFGRLTSAEQLITRLRGVKIPGEVALIRAAIARADEIFEEVKRFLRPGLTGRDIYNFMLGEVDRRNLRPAWSRDHCPIVTVGPVAPIGHTPPGNIPLQRGWTLQIDFGIQADGFCSDYQRMWYVLEEGETEVPERVQHLFNAVRAGVDAAVANIQPGNPNWKPVEAAHKVMADAGYPIDHIGVGHQLGRATHDGGFGLAPRKQDTPEWTMEPGNVFTAEGLETLVEGRGYVSLEEDVLVTPSGNQVLTTRQTEMWLIE